MERSVLTGRKRCVETGLTADYLIYSRNTSAFGPIVFTRTPISRAI